MEPSTCCPECCIAAYVPRGSYNPAWNAVAYRLGVCLDGAYCDGCNAPNCPVPQEKWPASIRPFYIPYPKREARKRPRKQ